MTTLLSEKTEKLIAWIIFLSIIGLVLTSLIPWISVKETSPVEGELFFNLDMMKKSHNTDMVKLSEEINFINTSFFLVLIFSIFTYLGLTIYRSRKYPSLSQLILVIGGGIIVMISVLTVSQNFNFITTVEDIEDTSIPQMFTSFKYAYLPLIAGVGLLIGSILYTWIVTSYSVKYFRDSIKQRKTLKTEETQGEPTEKDVESIAKEALLLKEADLKIKPTENLTYKHEEIEDWLKDEVQNIESSTKSIEEETVERYEKEYPVEKEEPKKLEEEQPIEKEEPKKLEEEQPIEKEEQREIKPLALRDTKTTAEKEIIKDEPSQKLEEEIPPIKKPIADPFKSKNKETETKIPEDSIEYKPFDHVLSSVIEKRHKKKEKIDVDNQETEASDIESDEEKEILTVRCPACKNVFTVEKTGDVINIKCPKCGKEGIVK